MSKVSEVQKEFSVQGMDCDSCELFVEHAARRIPGVLAAEADKVSGKLKVSILPEYNENDIISHLEKYLAGSNYSLITTKRVVSESRKGKVAATAVAATFIFIFLLLQKLDLVSIYSPDALTPFAIIIMGIIASLSSCMAIVGAVALALANRLESAQRKIGIALFHVGRVVGFAVLGGILGATFAGISNTGGNSLVTASIELLVAVILLFLGLDTMGIKLPFSVVLPKFFGAQATKLFDKNGLFFSLLIGISTFFLPCGFTQAMQFQAALSGSFVEGAKIMLLFAIGTFPLLALMSFGSTARIKLLQTDEWKRAMGLIIVFFAVLNLLGAGVKFGILPLSLVDFLL